MTFRLRFHLVVPLLALVALPACARGPSEEPSQRTAITTHEELAAAVAAHFDAHRAKGASGVVLLAEGSEIFLHHAFGSATCDGTTPMTPSHVFLIGSITKIFTKTAAYKLAEQGALRLDDPISRFLGPVPDDKAAITVRHLMEHTSGLPDIVDETGAATTFGNNFDYQRVSRAEIVRRMKSSKLLYEPGSDETYSNLGFSVLAAIIEKASGQPYEAFLRTQLFEPAGMRSTGYLLPDWSQAVFAEGCRGGRRWGTPYVDGWWMEDGPSWNLRGNGGMLGTAEDLLLWVRAISDGLFFPPELQRTYLDETLGRSRTFRQRASGPAGGNGIFNAFYLWLESADLTLVVMTNRAEHRAEKINDGLFQIIARYEGVIPDG